MNDLNLGAIVAFAGVGIVSAVFVEIIRRFGVKRALLDMPNDRSSHNTPIPRLGGSAFVPVILGAFVVTFLRGHFPLLIWSPFYCSAVCLFFVSVMDDIVTVSAGVRFSVHVVVTCAVVLASAVEFQLGVFGSVGSATARVFETVLLGGVIVWMLAMVNIYNFMDGVDGIAGVQAVVAAAGWGIIGHELQAPTVFLMSGCIAAATGGFLVLNWSPARIFMGDAGSTFLGFCFSVLPILMLAEKRADFTLERLLLAGALMVWPFLADAGFTMLRRLYNGENIVKPHRTHLYQRLAIAGISHRRIACVYGLLALTGVFISWEVVRGGRWGVVSAFIVVPALFGVLCGWVVFLEKRRIFR